MSAPIGRLIVILDDDPIPEGWVLADGSKHMSYLWPEFVTKMGIQQAMFTLPAQQRAIPGRRFIIKLASSS